MIQRPPQGWFQESLHLPNLHLQVMRISSKTKEGIPELWNKMEEFRDTMGASGHLEITRQKQHTVWMWNQIKDNIMKLFVRNPAVSAAVDKLEQQVSKGVITPGFAADILLQEFANSLKS